jgi:ABC-type uncharacterized transport system fused permease/ATPase subunit
VQHGHAEQLFGRQVRHRCNTAAAGHHTPAAAHLLLHVWCFCCSVWFNFVGRDFFNALAEKDVDLFKLMIIKYLFSFVAGIPVFVLADYYQVTHP